MNQLKRDVHNIHVVQNEIIKILRKMEEIRIEKENKNKEEVKKLQTGWGLF